MYRAMRILPAIAGFLFFAGADLSWGKDVHFVAREFEGDRSVWHTDTVLLERSLDPDEHLTFVLDNPTNTEHAFVMPGVQRITREHVRTPEQSVDIPEPIRIPYVEPVTVTVKPGERKHIRIHAGELLASKSVGKAFRFFCTIHKDVHQSGAIYVM
ncbi:hypothetical protein [Candidatus Nitrospira bockiana]